MLAKPNRLKADRDFKKVLKFGTFFSSKNLRLKVIPNNLDTSRFGFVIGTKVDKRSTVRNRLKRQVREVVRLLYQAGKIKAGKDISLNLSGGLLGKEHQEIKKEVEYLLNKAGLLN